MTEPACPFCAIAETVMLASNDLAFAIRDKNPVFALHTLILPRRHVSDIFGTTALEREAMHQLAATCRASIMAEDAAVFGFNYGSNVGAAAGQKVFHAHVHLIPRRLGEAPPPAAVA